MHQTVVKSTLEGTKLNGFLYLRSLSNYNMLLCSSFLQEVMKFTDFSQASDLKEHPLYTEQFCGITFYKTCFAISIDQKIEMDRVNF